MASTIYDFGMNKGDNVDYYLRKADRVIGVEANRKLCLEAGRRFAAEIEQGRLTVLNFALTGQDSAEPLTFYIHRTNDVLSQLPPPSPEQAHEFEPVKVPCRTPASIVREFGEPLYVKIDVEHYDQIVLANLFSAGIFPPEISAEAHSVEVFALMVANGYRSFSLVDGVSIPRKYGSATIRTRNGEEPFAFKFHSAGPFGEDIRSPWEDADAFLHTLAAEGLGWKDIHASKLIPPQPAPRSLARRQARALARHVLRRIFRR